MKAFQLGSVGKVKERKPFGGSTSEDKPKNSFVQKREGLIRGPQKEAEIHCKALTWGKNLTFSEDKSLDKERVLSKVITRKIGVGFKRKGEMNKRRWGWRLA